MSLEERRRENLLLWAIIAAVVLGVAALIAWATLRERSKGTPPGRSMLERVEPPTEVPA
jgi:hypothetical protein